MRFVQAAAFALVQLAAVGAAHAVLLVSDGFETTTHPTSTLADSVAPGVSYYTTTTGGNVSIEDDGVFGSKAAALTDTDGGTTFNTGLAGVFAQTALLTTVGDTLSVTFKLRFVSNNPGSDAIRFGFFDSTGTPASGTGGSNNDRGYYVNLTVAGSATDNLFFSESGATTPILGGGDRTNLASSAAGPAIASGVHNVAFSLSRISETQITLSLIVDSGSAITATTTGLRTSFDEFAFGTGFSSANANMRIDDIVVNATTVVPEPSSAVLLGAGFAGLIGARRRRV